MASRKKLTTKDKFDFDSGLDLPDFDFDAPSPKDDRKPATKIAAAAGRGLVDTLKSPAYIEKAVKKALPDTYGEAFDAAKDVKDQVRGLYDSAAKQIKPAAREFTKAVDKLIPEGNGRLKKFTKSMKDKFSENNYASSAQSKEQMQQSAIDSTTASIFQFQMETEAKREQVKDAKERVQQGVELMRHKDITSLLGGMANNVNRQTVYGERVTAAYHKKSLELQFRTYFAIAEQLEESKKTNATMLGALESINKNVALPDVVKMRKTEHALLIAKNKFFDKTTSFLGKKAAPIQKMIGNMGGTVMEIVSGVVEGLGMGTMMAEGAEQQAEMDEMEGGPRKSMKEKAAGKVAGWGADLALHTPWFKKLKDKIGGNKKIRTGSSWITRFMSNPGSILKNWSRQENDEDHWSSKYGLGILKDFMKDSVDKSGHDRTLDMKNKNLDIATSFTERTNKAITEIIPGYLARILREVQIQRTGDANVDMVTFDFKRNRFATNRSATRSALSEMVKKGSSARIDKDFEAILENLGPEAKNLSPEAREALKRKMLKQSANGDIFSAADYAKTSTWSLDKRTRKHTAELSKLFRGNFNLNDDGKIGRGDYEGLDKQNKINREMEGLNWSMGDPRQLIQEMKNEGKIDILYKLKIINPKNGQINMERFIDWHMGGALPDLGGAVPAGSRMSPTGRSGFAAGGFSGYGAKHEVKGAVHAEEGVLNADEVNAIGGEEGFNRLRASISKIAGLRKKAGAKMHGFGASLKARAQGTDFKGGFNNAKTYAQDKYKSASAKMSAGYGNFKESQMGPPKPTAAQSEKRSYSGLTGLDLTNAILMNIERGVDRGGFGLGGMGMPAGMSAQYDTLTGALGATGKHLYSAGKDMAGPLMDRARYTNEKIKAGAGAAFQGARGWLAQKRGTVSTALTELKKNSIRDVYVMGRNSPALLAAKMKLGMYRDKVTGQVIKTLGDLRAGMEITDENGNVVMSGDDVLNAVVIDAKTAFQAIKGKAVQFLQLSKTAAGAGLGMAVNFAQSMGDNVKAAIPKVFQGAGSLLSSAKSIGNMLIDYPVDIYIEGETSPRLLSVVMANGGYFTRKGNVIDTPGQIDGEVLDKDGNVLIRMDEVSKIRDKDGNTIKTPLAKLGAAAFAGVSKLIRSTGKIGQKVMDIVKNGMKGVGSWLEQGIFIHGTKTVEFLEKIHNMLDERLPGKKRRAGDWRDKQYKGKGGTGAAGAADILKRDEKKEDEEEGSSFLDKADMLMDGAGLLSDLVGWGDSKTRKRRRRKRAMGRIARKIPGGKTLGRMGRAGKGLVSKIPGAGMLGRAASGIGGSSLARGGLGLAGGALAAGGAGLLASGGVNTASGLTTALTGSELAGSTAGTATKGALRYGAKMLGKRIPGVGLAMGAGLAYNRWKKGEKLAAAGEMLSGAASTVPVIGTGISLALDGVLGAYDFVKNGGVDAVKDWSKKYITTENLKKALMKGIEWSPAGMLYKGAKAVGGLAVDAAKWTGKALLNVGKGMLSILGVNLAPAGLNTLRMAQYGFKPEDKEVVSQITNLEGMCRNSIKVAEDGKVDFDASNFPLAQAMQVFGIAEPTNEKDVGEVKGFITWFLKRFNPVFIAHMQACTAVGIKSPAEAEKLDKEKKLAYLAKVKVPNDPLKEMTGPSKAFPECTADKGYANDCYDATKEAVEKGTDSPVPEAAAAGAAAGTATTLAVANAATGKDASDAAAQESSTMGGWIKTALKFTGILGFGVSTLMDQFSDPNSMTRKAFSFAADAVSNFFGKGVNAIDAIRFKAYGLKEVVRQKTNNLRALEKAVLAQISFNTDGAAVWGGDVANIVNTVGGEFGVTKPDSPEGKLFATWFLQRFLPVFTTYMTHAKVATGSDKPQTAYENMTDEKALEAANALLGLGNVWAISASPWPGYEVGTDKAVVTDNLALIKDKSKDAAINEAKKAPPPATTGDKPKTEGGGSWWQSAKDMASNAYSGAVDTVSRGIETTATVVGDLASAGSAVIKGAGAVLKGKPKEIEQAVINALIKEGITDPKTLAHLMGQLAHESGNFRYMEEIASGAAYEGRKDLGNTQPGDGRRYKGRGPIQITGRANYTQFAKASGIDVVNNPELLSQPEIGTKAALWYLKSRKLINKAAAGDIRGLTKGINGGFNGLDDRIAKTQGYLARFTKDGATAVAATSPTGDATTPAATPAIAGAPPAAESGGMWASAKSMASSAYSGAVDATSRGIEATANAGKSIYSGAVDATSRGIETAANVTRAVGGAIASGASAVGGAIASGASAVGGVLGALLSKITEGLINLGKTHFKFLNKRVTLEGMDPTFMKLFWGMLGEAKQKGARVVQINDGYRSLAEQKRLWDLKQAGRITHAVAKPGTSRHGSGQAMDIETPNAEELIKLGLFEKYGFTRPLMHLKKPETWHIENKYVTRKGGPAPAISAPPPEKATAPTTNIQGAQPNGFTPPATAGEDPTMASGGALGAGNIQTASYNPSAYAPAANASNDVQSGTTDFDKSLKGVSDVLVQQLNIQKSIYQLLTQVAKRAYPETRGATASIKPEPSTVQAKPPATVPLQKSPISTLRPVGV